jgi:hypothetical protein
MSRLFWLGVGLAVGAIVVRKVTKKAHAYTPAGLSESVQSSANDLLESVRDFVEDVREGMAERESDLYAALAGERGEHGDAWDRATTDSGAHHRPSFGQDDRI